MSRTLALDYGRARCGCALADPSGSIVTPLPVVERPATRRGLAALATLVMDNDVGRVVVGLPLTLGGEEGLQAAETRAFSEQLARRVGRVQMDFYDERLTTVQAARDRGAAAEDSRAAAHLLEGYLAAQKRASGAAHST